MLTNKDHPEVQILPYDDQRSFSKGIDSWHTGPPPKVIFNKQTRFKKRGKELNKLEKERKRTGLGGKRSVNVNLPNHTKTVLGGLWNSEKLSAESCSQEA